MIDDYKYMYLYKPLYIMDDVMDYWFLLCFGVEGIRILALGWDALILPLVRNLYKPLLLDWDVVMVWGYDDGLFFWYLNWFSLFHRLLFGCGHIFFFYPDFIYGGSMEPAFGI